HGCQSPCCIFFWAYELDIAQAIGGRRGREKGANMTNRVSSPTTPSGFGGLIRKQREAMRMTVAQLAGRIGVSRNTITNYEAGKTEPSASDLMRLAGALGCPINDLLDGGIASALPRFAYRAHTALRKDPDITVAARKYLR